MNNAAQTLLVRDVGRIRDTKNASPNTLPILRGQDGRFEPRDDGVKRTLVFDNKMAESQGGELTRGLANVVVDRHGLCRWVDNNDEASDFFVPTGTAEEWTAFVSNAPAKVRLDACCPAKAVTLTASDGQVSAQTLDIGRENSTGSFGRRVVTHDFELTRTSDGAAWTETVTETFVCQNGEWTGQGAVVAGEEPGSWSYGAWGACSATCGGGTQQRPATCLVGGIAADASLCGSVPANEQSCGEEACAASCEPQAVDVTATWNGRWRRGNAKVNTTFAANGFKAVRWQYIEPGDAVVIAGGGKGERSVAQFSLAVPAKNTSVKVTAVYDTNGGAAAWSGNRTPKVAEFYVAEGQTIGQFNAPSVGAFYRKGDMGHPFMMINDTIFMPTYDNAPDLLSLVVEYQALVVPADASTNCQSPCTGYAYNGYCYHLSGKGESCDTTCANRGGCNLAGTQAIGSSGSNAACASVMQALGDYWSTLFPADRDDLVSETTGTPAGCYSLYSYMMSGGPGYGGGFTGREFGGRGRSSSPTTTCEAVAPMSIVNHRACACAY